VYQTLIQNVLIWLHTNANKRQNADKSEGNREPEQRHLLVGYLRPIFAGLLLARQFLFDPVSPPTLMASATLTPLLISDPTLKEVGVLYC
jgi:hypothetical protein